MDDGVGEEVAPLNVADGGRHIQGKDNEYFVRAERENFNVLESHELPSEGDYSRSTHQEFEEMFGGENITSMSDVNALEHPYNSSPRLMGDSGVTVEELTVRNFNRSNSGIAGTSANSGRVQNVQARQNQWQHLYQLAGGLGGGSSRGNNSYQDNGQRMNSGLEDIGYSSFPEFLAQKACNENQNEVVEELINSENRGIPGNPPGLIRTKILSKSGFSEFFVKNTLKGKGVIFRGPPQDTSHLQPRDQNNTTKIDGATVAASDISRGMDAKIVNPSSNNLNGKSKNGGNGGNDCDGVSLREWLKVKHSQVSKMVCLHIFRQIVELVDYSHSQGVALHRLRPSYFKVLPSNKVRYLGSPDKKEILQSMLDQDLSQSETFLARKRLAEENVFPSGDSAKKLRFSQNIRGPRQWLQFPTNSSFRQEVENLANVAIPGQRNVSGEFDEGSSVTKHRTEIKFRNPLASNTSELLEEKWYTSPEEIHEGSSKMSSNIYCLGVFLFELLARFDSDHQLAAAMSDLRHRILPPSFLSENPKEAGFCLWLLHPEPSSRPRTREILQSEVVVNALPEACTEDLSAAIEQDDIESDLLMHFLAMLEEQKQKNFSKLEEDIRCLEEDIEEILKRNRSSSSHSNFKQHLAHFSVHGRQNVLVNEEPLRSDTLSQLHQISNTYEPRLMKNIVQLESAYFSMRAKIQLPETNVTTRMDRELLRNRENRYLAPEGEEMKIPTDRVGAFFDGLCKYAHYSKFEVRGVLRNGEFNNSSNVICSLSFDRDEDYFAAAGVSKKIKIFEFNSLFNDSADFYYPALEMPNNSKLSCVCWNSYIKNYLASTDYDGAVKLWDATTGQDFSQYNEHEKRAWSVDFSQVDPTKLASGSDDCSVKLWSINEKKCLGTIRNIANVCCVQFSAHSTYLLAFGSADFRTYCYDLRYAKTPWCVLGGHEKAVSYVKFLDSETLVSASTDNSLKLWDLNKTVSGGLSSSACSLTLSGHTNEKNFVGLSVSNGYIACGSESNEVYAYHRSQPMPITSHKFGSIDSISGKETDDDNGQFVSSVCWRRKSEMVVAANSSGCIKVLQMV